MRSNLPGYTVPGHPDPDAAEEGRDADRAQPQAGAVRRPRRGDLGRGPGDHEAGREAPGADREHAARQGRVPRGPPAAPGHARHARHRLRQQGGHRLRHDHGDRRALGRPHHRQAVASSASARRRSTSTSTSPSSTRSCAPTCRSRPTRSWPSRTCCRSSTSWTPADWLKQIADWRKQFPLKYAKRGGLQGAARARPAGRAGRTRLHPDHRRRPAPDVGGAVLPHHQEPPLAVVGRRRNDGLRLPGRDRRAVRQPGQEGLVHRRRRRLPDDDVPSWRRRRCTSCR